MRLTGNLQNNTSVTPFLSDESPPRKIPGSAPTALSHGHQFSRIRLLNTRIKSRENWTPAQNEYKTEIPLTLLLSLLIVLGVNL